jgi:hypothetical protein
VVAQRELEDARPAGVPAGVRARARGLALSLWAVSLAFLVGDGVFSVLNRSLEIEGSYGVAFDWLFRLAFLVFPTVGALVASRQPRNVIGWLLLSVGVPASLSGFVFGWAAYALFVNPGSLPAGEELAWLSTWTFIPPIFGSTALLILLFPEGRYPSRRWRVAGWLTIGAIVAAALGTALQPGRLEEPPFERLENPFGLESAGGLVEVVVTLGWIALVASIVVAVAAMVVRLRRSRGLERQQLKWIAAAAGLFGAACVGAASSFALGEDQKWGQIAVLVAVALIPIAAGQAILRHRLYDIDVVVNRALVYGSLTALLAGSYFGLVLLFQLALEPLTEGNELAIAVSTLAVAALFRPARRRIQALVDRRFYRRKYDAERMLTGFATRLRDEVDLESLRRELTGAVGETMQPRHVSLWPRTPEARA